MSTHLAPHVHAAPINGASNPWHLLHGADGFILFVVAVLMLLSFVAWSLAVKQGLLMHVLHRELKRLQLAGSVQTSLLTLLGFAQLPTDFVDTSPKGIAQITQVQFDTVINACSARLERGLTLMANIATTAPYIGLLGTVWGIFRTLTTLSSNTQLGVQSLMQPLGETLLVTALGLVVAIPASWFYNLWISRSEQLQTQIQLQIIKQIDLAKMP